MSELVGFIRELTTLLGSAGVEYMITGSLASTYYAEPRSTVDVDVVAAASSSNLVEFVRSLDKERFYAPDVETVISSSQFNVISLTSSWKLDVIVRKSRPFSVMEFERRQRVNLLGIHTFIATPEDVVLAKLEWAKSSESERQLRDAKSIIEVQGEALDLAYLRQWAEELSVSVALERLLTT